MGFSQIMMDWKCTVEELTMNASAIGMSQATIMIGESSKYMMTFTSSPARIMRRMV
jgi:hypothetical protein